MQGELTRFLLIYRRGIAGDISQVNSFRCKVTQNGDRHQTIFYSAQGRKFKSTSEVSKFLNLSEHKNTPSGSQKGKTPLTKKGRPKNARDLENERKKITRELDKLMKNHEKASKALDDFQNEQSNDQSLIDDDMILYDSKKNKSLWAVLSKPEIDSFPGLPASCTQEVLTAWDFLCTFNRSLSLHPIALDDFAAALICKPTSKDETAIPPLYLVETHLALLKLLMNDISSDSWWWSTLETPETEAKEEIGRGEADNIAPTIKVDFVALIDYEEDPIVTRKWLQALEDIRIKRANAGGSIKAVIKSAVSLTTNPFVKSYLKKAMQGWKSGDAAFAKQSVMWLIGRVREARPDLWGRTFDPGALKENKAKVAHGAASAMEALEDVTEENVEDIHYGESDGEESDFEDDENDMETEEDFKQNRQDANRISSTVKEDLAAPVTTIIPNKPPPYMVDLLLPPYKPLFNSNLVSPFTWSFMVGASVSRILHRYKRLRNEVDDNLREFAELEPLTVGERRKREKLSVFRVLSECIAEAENGQECPIESAVEHLCSGRDYLSLTALQRLCILRVLIEAAYDTYHINQCVQDNINARTTAIKQLENEERRAKKEAKEEAAKVEMAARQRLAIEAKDEFISKKKREIIRKNKYTGEFTNEYLDSLTEDDIASFEEETKAEFDALPGPKQFSKNEVRTIVSKINDEVAFNTNELEALTLEEIQSRENNTLVDMEEELARYSDPGTVYSRDISAKTENLKREIQSFKEWQESLPASRAEAIDALKDAIEDGSIKALRSAIRIAKQTLLSGEDEETGGMWTLCLLRDAALELKNAEKRKRVTEAQKELIARRDKCFVRTEVAGKDRAYNQYWHFEHDVGGGVWYDAHFKIKSEGDESDDDATPKMNPAHIIMGAKDEENDLRDSNDKKFIKFSRQEYHPSGTVNSLVRHHNGCMSSSKSLRGLIKNLDSKGLREASLKTSLKVILEASGFVDAQANEGETEGADAVKSVGDDDHFAGAKAMASSNPEDFGTVQGLPMINSIQSAIGQRCRIRRVADEISAPDAATYLNGSVAGWKIKKTITEYHNPETEELTVAEKQKILWSVALDHGGEEEIAALELLNGLVRAKKWKHQYPGYFEHDSPLFSYRNKVGRFCGRAADAPYAASNLCFSKLMLKREQEFYSSLKSRTYENNWGGKSGLRNNWIATLKENVDGVNSLRDALLTLEDAFNELCGEPVEQNDSNSNKTAKELLKDDNLRCDIELESLGLKISGLWHCYDSRAVFREIISSSSALGIFALGLDLICRNCQAYLDATKPTVTRKSASNYTINYDQYTSASGRMTRSAYSTGTETQANGRRQNSWQQQNDDY